MTLLEKLEQAVESGATSMLFSSDELHTVHAGLMDTQRITFIVKNWGMDLDEVRALTDIAIETMPLGKLKL